MVGSWSFWPFQAVLKDWQEKKKVKVHTLRYRYLYDEDKYSYGLVDADSDFTFSLQSIFYKQSKILKNEIKNDPRCAVWRAKHLARIFDAFSMAEQPDLSADSSLGRGELDADYKNNWPISFNSF